MPLQWTVTTSGRVWRKVPESEQRPLILINAAQQTKIIPELNQLRICEAGTLIGLVIEDLHVLAKRTVRSGRIEILLEVNNISKLFS